MIKIEFKNDQITISGHSNYSASGSDIVCAAVSSMAILTINAIIKFNDKAITYKIDDGFLQINIIKHEKEIDLLITNLKEELKELEIKYSKYLKIY